MRACLPQAGNFRHTAMASSTRLRRTPDNALVAGGRVDALWRAVVSWYGYKIRKELDILNIYDTITLYLSLHRSEPGSSSSIKTISVLE